MGELATGCFWYYTCSMRCFVRTAQRRCRLAPVRMAIRLATDCHPAVIRVPDCHHLIAIMHAAWRRWPADAIGFEQLPWVESDVAWALGTPCLVKSRPLPRIGLGVLLPLNWARHFKSLSLIRSLDARKASTYLPFAARKATVVWRGATTGFGCTRASNVRLQLVERWSNDTSGRVDVGFTDEVQCYAGGGLPSWMKKERLPMRKLRQHKYILSLEGNDVATNLAWVLHTDSVPLMHPPRFETWLMHSKLLPWVHYVPIRRDGSDLLERLDSLQATPHKAEKIAHAGREFVRAFGDFRRDQALAAEVITRHAKIAHRANGSAPWSAPSLIACCCVLMLCLRAGGAVQVITRLAKILHRANGSAPAAARQHSIVRA